MNHLFHPLLGIHSFFLQVFKTLFVSPWPFPQCIIVCVTLAVFTTAALHFYQQQKFRRKNSALHQNKFCLVTTTCTKLFLMISLWNWSVSLYQGLEVGKVPFIGFKSSKTRCGKQQSVNNYINRLWEKVCFSTPIKYLSVTWCQVKLLLTFQNRANIHLCCKNHQPWIIWLYYSIFVPNARKQHLSLTL